MKSDWDDAPGYLRNKKKAGPWRMLAILGVGSAIIWGLIALFAKPIVIDVNQLKQAIRIDGQPLFSEQPAPRPVQDYSETIEPIRLPSIPLERAQQPVTQKPSQAEIEWAERMEAIAQARAQNSFNDDNYIPKEILKKASGFW